MRHPSKRTFGQETDKELPQLVHKASSDWLSAQEASDMLDVKRDTLYAYASRGKIRTRPGANSRERHYLKADLLRLQQKRQSRRGENALAADALAFGAPVLNSAISYCCETRGPVYRGIPAQDFVDDGASFWDVALHLWDVSDAPHLSFQAMQAPPIGGKYFPRFALSSHLSHLPLLSLANDWVQLAAAHPKRRALKAEAQVEVAAMLLAYVPTSLMQHGKPSSASKANVPHKNITFERAWLAANRLRVTSSRLDLVRQALIWVADHELNPSSFAARVAAGAGADLGACLQASLAVFSGPKHGAMAHRVHAQVVEVGAPRAAASKVRQLLDQGEALPGFSHPLYPNGDPRGHALLEAAAKMSVGASTSKALNTSVKLETLLSLVGAYELAGGPAPTLDPGLLAVAYALGRGPDLAMRLFAAGRTAGWLAHAQEQQQSGQLLRPRARYIGKRAP